MHDLDDQAFAVLRAAVLQRLQTLRGAQLAHPATRAASDQDLYLTESVWKLLGMYSVLRVP